eukprot:scaffold43663_cov32-Prasinocladus_malaysianus.AAC.1
MSELGNMMDLPFSVLLKLTYQQARFFVNRLANTRWGRGTGARGIVAPVLHLKQASFTPRRAKGEAEDD